ncbi:two-component system histidine kinase PnpS [Hathewaya limosa]|uniref:histidine kinase n=1 Tax=Hathewaya limosa TaxID=1536 RepID=A0ABU0JPG2_HATLI|nr:ATP-binding protein [Hathewaya limosa]MDQ0478972.1 two-component system phosphate regulon sensor histidine kinase PhoR [Hathewaya limosa]
MKKKIMISMFLSITIVVGIVIFLISKVFEYKQEELVTNYLRANNDLMRSFLSENKGLKKDHIKEKEIRVTYINSRGKVLFDTELNDGKLENHNERNEIKGAKEKGEGISLRKSVSSNKKMLYLATKLENGDIIRSSIYMDSISLLNNKFLNYYLIIIVVILIFTLWICNKITYIIVKPIKDLDFATDRIAKGELNRRVNITSADELGALGKNFNSMANKLQKTINEALDNQNRLEAILKCMDSGIIAVDRNFNVIMINPYAERIFGIDEDIMGKSLLNNIKDYELEKILLNNDNEYKEFKIMWPQERDLRIKTTDIINRNEHIGKVAVVQDITDIKKLENMRSQFVANVSHELKTPLTSIKGFAETLKEVDDVKYREKFLDIINNEAERLTRLINDILILSHIENKKEIKKEYINVDDLINDVFLLIKSQAESKKIKLTLEGDKIDNILGDGDKFKQMLINLIDNAVKYNHLGGYVKILCKSYDKYFTITVKDNGVGIPKSEISRLFERFYRVDKARSRANGGTGLGLAIVKHIIILFNGEIFVESELGKGSLFIVKIPYEEG